MLTALASAMTPIQRRYPRVIRVRGVVGSAIYYRPSASSSAITCSTALISARWVNACG